MMRHLYCLVSLGAALLSPCVIHADVTVRYEHPEHYTDLGLSGSTTPSIQADLMRKFETHFKSLGEQYLPKDETLEVVVLDIDMAGSYEPWRTPNLTNTRFIRDIYPPKFSLHYRWQDKNGDIKADRQDAVSDLNYLMRLDSRQYPVNDPVRYEKALLDSWFRETFSPREQSTP